MYSIPSACEPPSSNWLKPKLMSLKIPLANVFILNDDDRLLISEVIQHFDTIHI